MEYEHQMYDQLTNWTSLREDDDITARIVATNTSRGALKEVWHNPHLDLQSHSNELAPSYPQETENPLICDN